MFFAADVIVPFKVRLRVPITRLDSFLGIPPYLLLLSGAALAFTKLASWVVAMADCPVIEVFFVLMVMLVAVFEGGS